MPGKTDLFVDLVWSTRNGRPLIADEIEPAVCAPHAICGTLNHVHVLCRLDPAMAVVQFMAPLGPAPEGGLFPQTRFSGLGP